MVYVNVLEEARQQALIQYHTLHPYRESFAKMLEQFVPNRSDVQSVVDLGCGHARAGYPLQRHFHTSWDVEYLGIDRDEKRIATARMMLSYLKGFNFIIGNAEHIEGTFDVATILNPNIAEFRDSWNTIVGNVRKHAKRLIATALQPSEYHLLEDAIRKAGYEIKISTENPHAEPKNGNTGLDKYVIIAHS